MSPILHDIQKNYFSAEEQRKLASVTIGIIGLGGLGSNCAFMLARSGIENFILMDFDTVDATNLNRQQYWPSDIGKNKTDALASRLLALNPSITLLCINQKLDEGNKDTILQKTNLWVEAVDKAETKACILETAARQGSFVVSASGISGCGKTCLTRRVLHNCVLVGDFVTDCADAPPLAPRVTWAAAMLADAMLEKILR